MKSIFTALLLISLLPSFAQVTFTDVATTMNVDDIGNGQGVASIDFNNDGFPDILLNGVGQDGKRTTRLYRNVEGPGNRREFIEEIKTTAELDTVDLGASSWIDYDNDGRIFLNFEQEDLTIGSRVVHDVPYLWGPTIAEVRVWQ